MDDYLSPLISINPHCPLMAPLLLLDKIYSGLWNLYNTCMQVKYDPIVGTQTLKKLAIFHACIHCHKNPPTSNKSTHFNTCTHIYILQLQVS